LGGASRVVFNMAGAWVSQAAIKLRVDTCVPQAFTAHLQHQSAGPVITIGAPNPSPDNRCADSWNRLVSPVSLANFFGWLLRDNGQNLVPDPADKII